MYHTATTVNLPLTVHVCIAVKFVTCGGSGLQSEMHNACTVSSALSLPAISCQNLWGRGWDKIAEDQLRGIECNLFSEVFDSADGQRTVQLYKGLY